jgi:hypothetical protein
VVLHDLEYDLILHVFELIDRLLNLLALKGVLQMGITNVDFLLSSLMRRSPTLTKLNLKYSDRERANSRTFDPGGPMMNIFFSEHV